MIVVHISGFRPVFLSREAKEIACFHWTGLASFEFSSLKTRLTDSNSYCALQA